MDQHPNDNLLYAAVNYEIEEERIRGSRRYHDALVIPPPRGTEFQFHSTVISTRPTIIQQDDSLSSVSSSSQQERQLTKFYRQHPFQQHQLSSAAQQQQQEESDYLHRPIDESDLFYEPTRDGNAWSSPLSSSHNMLLLGGGGGRDGILRPKHHHPKTKKVSFTTQKKKWENELYEMEGLVTKNRSRRSSRRSHHKSLLYFQDDDEDAEEDYGETSTSSYSSSSASSSLTSGAFSRFSEGLFFVTLILGMAIAGLSFKYGDTIKHEMVRLTDNFRNIPSTLYCNVILIDIAFEHGFHLEDLLPYEFYECIPFTVAKDGKEHNHGDFSYQIRQLPLDFIEEFKNEILKGNFQMSIEGGELDEQQMIVRIPDGAKIEQVRYEDGDFVGNRRRRLQQQQQQPTIGEKKILVLRISTLDVSPHFPADALYSYIFDPDEVSVRSQYEQCSFGKLTFQPTTHGVLDINLDKTLVQAGQSPAALVAAATKSAREALGVKGTQSLNDIADFVFYCLPEGTGHWAAYSGVNHWRSVYNDQWCAYQTGNMHELGHGLGLYHANEGNDRYTDFTGYMGAGYAAVRWPQRCFNGQNNWQLGWYSDRSTEVELAADARMYKVVSFVHYDRITNDNEYVVLKMEDLYMQFNVDKDFNRDTGEKNNQLTIVEASDGDTNLVGGLDMNANSLRWGNYKGSGSTLIIEVCDLVLDSDLDHVMVSIGLDRSLCPNVDAVTRQSPVDTGGRCDDSPNGWFFVDSTIGNQQISALQQCGWLLENANYIDMFCIEGTAAYEVCPETCGKCSDNCEDGSGVQFEVEGLSVDCEWLRIRPTFWESTCVEGSVAYNECQETCNSCSDVQTIDNTENDVECEDTTFSVFWVDTVWGYQSCFWLSAMPQRQAEFCVEGGTAYLTCPETCGVCDDSCNDGEGLFLDSNGIQRDCSWLSLRPFYWDEYCVEGHEANDLCVESCQTC